MTSGCESSTTISVTRAYAAVGAISKAAQKAALVASRLAASNLDGRQWRNPRAVIQSEVCIGETLLAHQTYGDFRGSATCRSAGHATAAAAQLISSCLQDD